MYKRQELVNGANNNSYRTINLSGSLASGDYYVICTRPSSTPNCDLDVSPNQNYIQDGSPDGLLLLNNMIVVDALSYEGDVAGVVEGSATELEDDGTLTSFGLSRLPNGTDTDNNNEDFGLTVVTPGEENFASSIFNPSICQLGEAIPDNNCDETNQYEILVTGIDGTSLGTEVTVSKVNIIIQHTFTGDLEIHLISPSGEMVLLSSLNGGSEDNYGDPNDSSCSAVTSFDMTAAVSIVGQAAPFIGSFIPEGDFADYNDGSDPNGTWTLQICDLAGFDVGELEFIEIEFEVESDCPPSFSEANGNPLTGIQSMDATFETDGIIESNQTIAADVTYNSGTEINLLRDFEVLIGRIFEAFIDGCSN